MLITLPTGIEPVTFRLTVECSRPTELGKQMEMGLMCEGISRPSHKVCVYYFFCEFNAIMREAGFEPAHPEITRLKLVVLDHSTIRAKHYWGAPYGARTRDPGLIRPKF